MRRSSNHHDTSSDSTFVRQIFQASLFVLVCVVWLSAESVTDAEPPAYSPDLYHTYQARLALFNDPILKPLNLGVRVHHQQAILWGPVPTQQQAHHAENVLRQLPFLKTVSNQLEVEQDDSEPQWQPAETPLFLPVESRVTPEESKPVKPATGWVPAQPAVQTPADSNSPKAPPPEAVLRTPVPAETVSTAKPKPIRLQKAIASLLATHSQFRVLSVNESDGVVSIRGTTAQTQLIYDLARMIAKMPNVVRVVVRTQ